MEECDLAYRKIGESLEEEKEQMNKRQWKAEDKFDNRKSDISAFTNKTNKTTGGKHWISTALVVVREYLERIGSNM
jgi:hypothetical protein